MEVIMNKEVKEAIERVVDFYWDDEKRHWEEMYNPNDHIFTELALLRNHLNRR